MGRLGAGRAVGGAETVQQGLHAGPGVGVDVVDLSVGDGKAGAAEGSGEVGARELGGHGMLLAMTADGASFRPAVGGFSAPSPIALWCRQALMRRSAKTELARH